MSLVGVSTKANYEVEVRKIDELSQLSWRPDVLMDLSIVKTDLLTYLTHTFPGPVGTLPHYLVYNSRTGIDATALIERIHEVVETGVAFITIHPTPNRSLYEVAKRVRPLPSTARGGGMIIRDMLINRREESVFAELYADILGICAKYGVAISIGAAFRPSNIFEALDEAHVEETALQQRFISAAKAAGVQVIQEGLGHIRLSDLPRYVALIEKNNVPFMPLGPMITDAAVGFDHVVSAIGASHLGLLGFAQMINSVTREEHTGRVPSHRSILEGVMTARTASHAINISRFPKVDALDRSVAKTRGENRTCVVAGGIFEHADIEPTKHGCNRCSFSCPLHLA
jgi:phosphomethylpyrimidine synthase